MDMSVFDKAAGCLPDLCFEHRPDLGIVLGSGWGDALPVDETLLRLPYSEIPGLGQSTVKGHVGELVVFLHGGRRVVAWCGRRHYYEGVGWEPVVLPIEILRRMACPRVLLTNAAGGISPLLCPGDFVVIRDHINLVGINPLVGPHVSEWGERFPDMTEVYTRRLVELLHAAANRHQIRALDGVYAFTCGPVYETPAEIQSYRIQGVDVVGMSTVPEATLARACGMQVAGLSLVSNLAAGIARQPLTHEEVVAAGRDAKPRMRALLDEFITRL